MLAAAKTIFILPELTYWILPAGCALKTVFVPCKPPLLGSFLLCEKGWSNTYWKLLVTPILSALEFGMAMKTLICGAHYGLFCHISGQAILWGRCQELLNSKNKNVDFLVKGYRQLQIQEKIHNSSYRGRILPIVIFAIPLFQILSGFGLIVLFDKTNFVQISIFLITYLDALVFGIVVLTFASSIYLKSEFWIRNVRQRIGKNSGYFQRIHKSFRPLRLEFGNNYVGRMTPLVMQEFCILHTASLVLLEHKK